MVYDLLNEPGQTDSGAKAQETNESGEDVGGHLSGEGTRNDLELTQRPRWRGEPGLLEVEFRKLLWVRGPGSKAPE